MGNLWYNEPKTLDVAFDVIGDIVLSAASQQYGGFTVPSADLILEPYAEKSYKYYIEKYKNIGLDEEKSKEIAMQDIQRDFEQGFQGWEYKFNSGIIKPRRLSVHNSYYRYWYGTFCKDGVKDYA